MYHVTFRGNERRAIFRDDADRNRLLKELEAGVEDYEVRLYLWCLMSNHVHLLVETPRANISSFMGGVLTGYSVYFNRRHRRHGHLTQGRFHSPLVEGDRYLLKLSRYIHLNPVCVGAWKSRSVRERRDYLRRYRWSSYRGYVGKSRPDKFVEYQPVLRMLGGPGGTRRGRYRDYVEAGLAERDEELAEVRRQSALAIGSEFFVRRIRERYEKESGERVKQEDVSFRRGKRVVEPRRAIEVVCGHFGIQEDALRSRRHLGPVKPVLAAVLVRYAALTQREVAEVMGLGTGAAVCQHLRKLDSKEGKNLRKLIERITKQLNI